MFFCIVNILKNKNKTTNMSNTFGGSFTETIGIRSIPVFDTRMPSPNRTVRLLQHVLRTTTAHKRAPSRTSLSLVERHALFSVVPRAPPAPEAEHGDADDEADQDQDEDDAARDHAHRVH